MRDRDRSGLQQISFYLVLAAVSVAFCFVLWPYAGAVFWGAVLAIIFTPANNWLARALGGRRNLAALLTLTICLLIVVLPLVFLAGALLQEGNTVFQQIRSGQIDFGNYFQRAIYALPPSLGKLLERLDLADIGGLQQKLTAGAAQASQFVATRALSIGQNTFQFMIGFGVMMYLLFFLLRDGPDISRRIIHAIPLEAGHKEHLLRKFTTVARATVKGNLAVAAVQGALGGLIFWILGIQGALLWAVLMAFLSLLPAVGASLIWGPVAIYFLLTGETAKGIVLIAFGAVVIGTVDNLLRPILVGKDTRMPDWVVLISTLGGMSLFGLNGFVIGPLIAALFIAAWDLSTSTREEIARREASAGSAGAVDAPTPAPADAVGDRGDRSDPGGNSRAAAAATAGRRPDQA
ncbi:AI-2E family transporter [Cupriavidus sp. USMAA2-4]|uniref:AI-2E family transporter n=1 Tax=Cupriavidus sp. USMAA2-4 TaxID=876364 RepID=UPI0009FE2B58|nr:AI-2E family transporter [Cupriavidus sp. USMAA2-4]